MVVRDGAISTDKRHNFLQGFLFLGDPSKLSDSAATDLQQTFFLFKHCPVFWICIGFSAYPDPDPAFYPKADPGPDPGN